MKRLFDPSTLALVAAQLAAPKGVRCLEVTDDQTVIIDIDAEPEYAFKIVDGKIVITDCSNDCVLTFDESKGIITATDSDGTVHASYDVEGNQIEDAAEPDAEAAPAVESDKAEA